MRPCRRMNCPKKYHTNNMNQNQRNDTTSELNYSTLEIQDMDTEHICCEELFRMYEKNYEYMKSLYPSLVRRIQKEVEEECDKREHTGSCMFDEWPDRTTLDSIADNICRRMKYLDKDDPELQAEDLSMNPLTALESLKAMAIEGAIINPIGDYTRTGRPHWYHSLILTLLYNEMLYRRIRYYHRRYCSQKF